MYPILGIDGKLVENADELMETFPNALRESDATQGLIADKRADNERLAIEQAG
jgi:hypothetical protein